MFLRSFACLVLVVAGLVAGCTTPNPAFLTGDASAGNADGGTMVAVDLAAAPTVDQGMIAADLSTVGAADLSHHPQSSNPDLADATCKDFKDTNACSNHVECYWTGMKCKSTSEPFPNCDAYTSKTECVLVDDCAWQQYGELGTCYLTP